MPPDEGLRSNAEVTENSALQATFVACGALNTAAQKLGGHHVFTTSATGLSACSREKNTKGMSFGQIQNYEIIVRWTRFSPSQPAEGCVP